MGISGGFIVGLVGGFVLAPIWLMASEGDTRTAANIQSFALLLMIPVGLIIGIMVPIRKASRLRQAEKAEEEARSQGAGRDG